MELEFATNKELIKELLKRATFAGIIVSTSKEIENNNMTLDEWEFVCKNITPIHAKQLLEFVANKIENS